MPDKRNCAGEQRDVGRDQRITFDQTLPGGCAN
jgi:hypothetical protein